MNFIWKVFWVIVLVTLLSPIVIGALARITSSILPDLNQGSIQYKISNSINEWAKK